MAQYSEAKGSGHRGKKLEGLMVRHGKDNKGYVVEHHYEQDAGSYHKPEPVPFGEGEGQKMLTHVGQHMGVDAKEEASEDE